MRRASLICMLFFIATATASAAPNPVQVENALPGTTAWNATRNTWSDIYATQLSIAPGEDLDFHVSQPYRYRIAVYRLGWYGGAGGRLVACAPSCAGDKAGSILGGQDPADAQPLRANWPVTDVIHTDASWTSGYYAAEAVQTVGSAAGTVAVTYFVVHQAPLATPSQILVQVPTNTWEAYNDWGGRSLYNFVSPRAYHVSFQRPFGGNAQTPLWNELQLVRFLERNGYDVSYQDDQDTDANPGGFLHYRLVMDNGHDEYWTMGMRNAWDGAVAGGTNLAFMATNDAYWHVEYEDNRNTIFTMKSLSDPNPNPAMKTAMFREIGKPECLLEGVEHNTLTIVGHPLDYTVTAAGAADPWLKGTGLVAGSTLYGIVGREHDAAMPGCTPANATVFFHYDNPDPIQNADALRYTAPSGARVFSTGAWNFTWALDAYRSDDTLGPAFPMAADRLGGPVDPRIQIFMQNALDDLTRPAPPLSVRERPWRGSVRITTGWPTDSRIVGRDIWIVSERDGSRALVCTGHARCIVNAPAQPGAYHAEAAYVDAWGGVSAPIQSASWQQP